MKKFLSYALVAVMLVAAVAVSASALTWNAGEGLWVHTGPNYSGSVATEQSPVILTNNADGTVTVEQGGYWKAPYIDGGIFSAEQVGLDGLSVEVFFEKAPIATNDCWFAIHLLNKSQLFTTDAETLGYKNLIRFYDPKMEYYKSSWGGQGTSEVGANNNIFAIQSGDTIIMNVKYELGQYVVSYVHKAADGEKTFTVPADKTLDLSKEVFNATGKAYVSVCGSLLGADSDWKYTIKVTEGVGLTDAQVANQEFEQSKATHKATIDAYVAAIENHKKNALSFIEGKDASADTAINESLDAIEKAIADVAAAAEALVAAANIEEADAALAMAQEAKAAASNAEATVEEMASYLEDASAEEPAEDEAPTEDEAEAPADEAPKAEAPDADNTEDEGGFPVVPVVVVVVIVVVAIVAVVLGKKKKN